ncbi:putative forkhead-associated (FHA) domain, SMAD/FHA domain superfamily, BRCT domain superfamily [Plasmopara halstedii]
MWVLDVVEGDGAVSDTTFYLIAGEWSVGRKRCHVNFHTDSSISRTHALIRVGALTPEQLGDSSTCPSLELVDKNSRFGSFVNQKKIVGTCSLQHGDLISFGAKKTILRVRNQVFVLVASRIQRANRANFMDTCQRIGMHLVTTENKDATHCIMDPGRIVATVKVLWALVFTQPVVCTPWIYAIANRLKLSEPLPRCEEFLPSDPSIPFVESNYLPNPLRKSLFQGYAVLFLNPQPMEELIAAMGGIVVRGYENNTEDDTLLHELGSLASSKCLLLIEPHGTGIFNTAGLSEQRVTTPFDPICPVEIVDQRVALFKSMGAVFTSVQELAASVIFVKPPTPPNDSSFSSSLANCTGPSSQNSGHLNYMNTRGILSTAEKEHQKITDANQEEEVDVAYVTNKENSEKQFDLNNKKAKDVMSETMQISTTGEKKEHASANKIKRDMLPNEMNDMTASAWKSSRILQQRDVKFEEADANKPIVVCCPLITRKREPSRHGEMKRLVNYKRFKKSRGCSSRSITSLFPQKTVVSVVDNAERRALQENMEAMEAQERIAEELFAMGEGRTKTKLF